MSLIAIVAATPNWVIGDQGAMPWRLSTDLKRFKRLTMGSPILMGRKTFDSIGRPLPGRSTWVLTRQANWQFEGVTLIPSMDEARRLIALQPRVFIVGGAEVYRQFHDQCDEVYLTRVWSQVNGDTKLTDFDLSPFEMTYVERIPQGPKDDAATEFQIWVRRASQPHTA